MLSSRGIPEGAVVSIRAGAVRRQGNLSSRRPYRFPRIQLDGDHLVQIDLMQKIGSGYAVLRPLQEGTSNYNVCFDNNPDKACEIEVKVGTEDVGERAAPEPSAEIEREIEDYMDRQGIVPFMQSLLKVVAKEKPQDAFAFMAPFFSNGYQTGQATVSSEGVASPAVSSTAVPVAPARAERFAAGPVEEEQKAVPEESKSAPPAEQPVSPAAPLIPDKPAAVDKAATVIPEEAKSPRAPDASIGLEKPSVANAVAPTEAPKLPVDQVRSAVSPADASLEASTGPPEIAAAGKEEKVTPWTAASDTAQAAMEGPSAPQPLSREITAKEVALESPKAAPASPAAKVKVATPKAKAATPKAEAVPKKDKQQRAREEEDEVDFEAEAHTPEAEAGRVLEMLKQRLLGALARQAQKGPA